MPPVAAPCAHRGAFTATQFLADVDGRPDDPALARALEELAFFSADLRILGTYRAHHYRLAQRDGN